MRCRRGYLSGTRCRLLTGVFVCLILVYAVQKCPMSHRQLRSVRESRSDDGLHCVAKIFVAVHQCSRVNPEFVGFLSAAHTHTQPFNGLWSGTTHVGRYQKKHSPNHTHPDRRTSFINFLHLLRSTASALFSLRAWQSFLTTSLQVLFGLPLCFVPSTSYSMHFFTQSSS